MRRFLLVLAVLGCVAVVAETANAQFIKFGPQGSIGIRNGFGGHTYFYPRRFVPGANQAVPGSYQVFPGMGDMWLGQDGQMHGNMQDPSNGDMHLFSHKSGQGGQNNFLVEPEGNRTIQRHAPPRHIGPVVRPQPRWHFQPHRRW
jgi:hypothetical protein